MKNKVVTFGEIMLRLATPGYLRFAQTTEFEATFGGGEANVAVSLANYGIPASFVSSLPKNDIGEYAIQTLRGLNVDTSFINRSGDRVGIYYLESGAVSRGSKVIYDRANSSFAKLKKGSIDWDKAFQDATWFHWTGITPAVSEGAAEVCLEACEAAAKKGITISTDLNFRNKLWKWGKSAGEVMEKLVNHCEIILGNEEDAEMVFGIKPDGVDVKSGHVEGAAYESVGKQLMAKFPKAKKVIITLRGSISASHNSWSGVLWDGKKLMEAPTYQITHIVDRVGGGDSFMGGLIYGLISYPKDDQKALGFAVAASCLKHTIKGDFNAVTVDEVEKLMSGDASGRVSR
ncbi:MAG TPA: sugar kinase [Chryseolinea sp.]|nr:sugar kinase [Chryseolinea sp.]